MTVTTLTRTTLTLALVLGLTLPVSAQVGEAIDIGSSLPLADRSMPSANGSASSFAQAMGDRGLAVIFWCNTCPWVKKYEDRVVALASEYEAAGFGFIAVNSNDPVAYPEDGIAEMRAQASANGYSFPYVVDEGSEAAKAFGATRTPQVYLFNATGTLVYEGTVDDSPSDPAEVEEPFFRNALNQLVAGESITVQKTNAFGCTIKFQ